MANINQKLVRIGANYILPNLPPHLAFSQGNFFFVKPKTGSDVNASGKTPDQAFKTVR